MSNKKGIRILKITLSALWWLCLAVGLALVVSLLAAHMRGEVPHLFGYSVINIISESMEPTIEQGEYILIKQVPPEDVQKNDIICFYSTDPAIYGYLNTHRVVEEPFLADGDLRFITKGDHNLTPDHTPAEGDKLVGVYVKHLRALTVVLTFLNDHMIAVFAVLFSLGTAAAVGGMAVAYKKEKAANADCEQNKA